MHVKLETHFAKFMICAILCHIEGFIKDGFNFHLVIFSVYATKNHIMCTYMTSYPKFDRYNKKVFGIRYS